MMPCERQGMRRVVLELTTADTVHFQVREVGRLAVCGGPVEIAAWSHG